MNFRHLLVAFVYAWQRTLWITLVYCRLFGPILLWAWLLHLRSSDRDFNLSQLARSKLRSSDRDFNLSQMARSKRFQTRLYSTPHINAEAVRARVRRSDPAGAYCWKPYARENTRSDQSYRNHCNNHLRNEAAGEAYLMHVSHHVSSSSTTVPSNLPVYVLLTFFWPSYSLSSAYSNVFSPKFKERNEAAIQLYVAKKSGLVNPRTKLEKQFQVLFPFNTTCPQTHPYDIFHSVKLIKWEQLLKCTVWSHSLAAFRLGKPSLQQTGLRTGAKANRRNVNGIPCLV
jgi:hypothetical protein